MKNNHLASLLIATTGTCAFVSCTSGTQSTPARPNIVYILADDMGYGDVKALNPQSKIPTPVLDSMVHNGIAFTDAHTNSAVSTPTRYGILTGRYTFRSRLKNGVLVGHEPALIEPDRETVGSLLQRNGYTTACVGKWHLGLDWAKKDESKPLFEGDLWDIQNTENTDYMAYVGGGPKDHGFDYSYIMPASLDIAPYLYIENGKVTASTIHRAAGWKSDEARGMWYRQGDTGDDFKHEETLDTFIDKSIAFINGQKESDKPFFLYLPLTAPHTPWLPSAQFRGKSGAGVYGDFVCMVDHAVGRVQEALKQAGLAENTIVIFTSDNGAHWLPEDIATTQHQANAHFSGMKSDVWEGGHRVPFIVTWPQGIKNGKRSDEVICTTDLMATCAEMIGVSLSENSGEDSFSFWKVLTGESYTAPLREATIHHSISGEFALRQGDWVYIDCKGSGGWSKREGKDAQLPPVQLYNVVEDPQEMNNLCEQYPEKVVAMKALLEKYKNEGRSRSL